jgi:RNA polymerase sigma-70 factor (ECF subfamily)
LANYRQLDDETLGRFRAYLKLLAQNQIDAWLVQCVDASDLVQQTLLKAIEQADQFHGNSDAEYLAWLRQILARNLIDAFRFHSRVKRNLARHCSLEDDITESFRRIDALADSQLTPSQRAATNELLLHLPAALEALPRAQREAIMLHHLQGLKLSETSERMGRSELAVAGLLHRGLKRLYEILDA